MSTAAVVRDGRWLELERKHASHHPNPRCECKDCRAEFPRETSFRGASSLTALTEVLDRLPLTVNTSDRLEQLERELYQLLAATAPAAWSSHRRVLVRVLRTARRERRALERASIGEIS